jgi:hypothetical protein
VKPAPGKEVLTGKMMRSLLRRGRQVFHVDEELRLTQAEEGSARLVDCEKKTEEEKAIGIMVCGGYKYELLCGKITDEENVRYPGAGPLMSSKFHHPMGQFEILLSEHKMHCVDREQNVRYWHDRKKRILLAEPNPTEAIFHLSLFWWLKTFVIDKLKILGETVGLGQDKTDIEVVTPDGNYLVEIKWLGENKNGATYGQSAIDTGLAQLKIYLEHDDEWQFVCAHLVVYDGRPLEIHQAESGYDEAHRHSICKPPHILFLESETPSESARRITR